jgi:hypothetical protein
VNFLSVTILVVMRLTRRRTRISCRAALDMATCAAFVKESRIKIVNATKLNRKSWVAEWRDLRFLFGSHAPSKTWSTRMFSIHLCRGGKLIDTTLPGKIKNCRVYRLPRRKVIGFAEHSGFRLLLAEDAGRVDMQGTANGVHNGDQSRQKHGECNRT